MNKFFKTLLTFSLTTAALLMTAVAQDANYGGPAKNEVRSFWRQAAMFQNGRGTATTLSNMEKMIAAVKQKDPGYDTASMDKEISDGQVKVDAASANQAAKKQEIADTAKSGNDAITAKIAAGKIFEYLFEQSLTTGSPSSAKLQTILNEYNAKAAELLAMNFGARDRTNQSLKMTFSVLDSRTSGATTGKGVVVAEKAAQDENEMLGDAGEERVKIFLYKMQLGQAKWDAARKLFPGEAGYEAMYQSTTAELAKYGSVEDVQKNIQKNNLEAIKNRRLPAPEIIDPVTEKLFVDTFNKYLSEEMKGKGYKAILKQKDWGIIRNQVTGVVLGRKRQAAIAFKGHDNKCYVRFGIIVEEQYIGGTFQGAKAFDARYGGGELPCEFAK